MFPEKDKFLKGHIFAEVNETKTAESTEESTLENISDTELKENKTNVAKK